MHDRDRTSSWQKLLRFLRREFAPVTKGLILIEAAVFLSALVFGHVFPYDLLVLYPANVLRRPWMLVTYPLVNGTDLLSLAFGALWLWLIGGSLERRWRSRKYGLFLILAAAATGGAMTLAAWIFSLEPVAIYGIWLLLTGPTWAWAESDPWREILFMGILPVKARWLAWIQAGLTFIAYAGINLVLGLASLSGIAVAYFFLAGGPFRGGRGRRRDGRRNLRVVR